MSKSTLVSSLVFCGLGLVAVSGHAMAPKVQGKSSPTTKLPTTTTMPTATPVPVAKPKAKAPLPGPTTSKPMPKIDVSKLAKSSPLFSKSLNDGKTTLRGFVDLHTHPMAHLAFGGHLLHGAPDVGVLMPAGQIYRDNDCNQTPERAKDKKQALGSCYAAHAGKDWIKNKCGNDIRRLVLNGFEDGNHTNKPHDVDHPPGFPSFTKWPKHDDILHQQMWVDWTKRSYEGGMRVMVALAVNNYTLAHGLEASSANPRRDKASGDLQIDELKKMVAKHSWMEIAYSAADVRRIVGERDKMAVIIGVELDDMGDFLVNKSKPSPAAVRKEIQRLHGKGVRYAFPIHLVDNYFGGTAVYEDEVNRANCFHAGDWWQLKCTDGKGPDEFGIKHKVSGGWDVFVNMKLGHCGGSAPIKTCKAGEGHMNTKGLSKEGEAAISEMMRLGMLIDVDHTSLETFRDILDHTKTPGGGYPLVSGHNGLRAGTDGLPVKPGHEGTENQRTKAQYIELAKRKGIAGIGWGTLRADEWRKRLHAAGTTGIQLALGSDINGMVVQPAPRQGCSASSPCVSYSSSFPKPDQWDYNRDGVAHVGLFPDVLRDVETQPGGDTIVDGLFNGAEGFAVMWERAESLKQYADKGDTNGISIVKAEYGRNCGLSAANGNIRSFVQTQCDGKTTCDYEFTWAKWGGDPSPSMCSKDIAIEYKCTAAGAKKTISVKHTKTPQKVRLSCP
mgnify:CR=1 FL=1